MHCEIHSSTMCLSVCLSVCLSLPSGTIMTPNYVSNSSMEVSQWCTCEASGNEWQDCRHILNLFTSNPCLRKTHSSSTHTHTTTHSHRY